MKLIKKTYLKYITILFLPNVLIIITSMHRSAMLLELSCNCLVDIALTDIGV